MKIGDILYFSPKYKFIELDWNDKEGLIKAFEDRVSEYYLKPIEEFNKRRYGFASGVLSVTTIDFLARIATRKEKVEKEDFKAWLEDNIDGFNYELATKLYEDFRCGLIHEGRIKNCGQFSYDIGDLIWLEDGVMIVNPELLIERIKNAFKNFIRKIREDDEAFQSFKETLKRDFQDDTELSRKMMK